MREWGISEEGLERRGKRTAELTGVIVCPSCPRRDSGRFQRVALPCPMWPSPRQRAPWQ